MAVVTKDVVVSEELETSRQGVDLGRYMKSLHWWLRQYDGRLEL